MIRVAMLSEFPGDGDSVDGGVQAVSKYLVDALVEAGDVEVHVLDFDYSISSPTVTRTRNHWIHRIPASRLGAFTLYRRDQSFADAQIKNICPDIVHSQGAGHYGVVATRSGYPTIVTIHGIMSEEARHAPDLRKKFRRWFVSQLSERYCIRRYKHTILISPYVRDYYGNRLTGPKVVIPNPVAPGFFEMTRKEKPGRILFAGRLLPLKGVHDLLEAAAAVSKDHQVEIVLAGSLSNKPYVHQLRQLVTQLDIADNVHFQGILSETDLLDEFARASMLVLPSYQETAPMVIQEAMAAGLPVIASQVGGIPYQIDDGKSGLLFEAGDIKALTGCIRLLFTDRSLRETISASARHHAENNFRAGKVAEFTVAYYRRILSSTADY